MYNELVKNFERVRGYMREFYVYGFRRRDEFTSKSARSYDDERRRVESWLQGYMSFRRTAEGKQMFLSIDSREESRNPLHRAWRAKSFTDTDITLHFLLLDLLHDPAVSLTLGELLAGLDALELPCVWDDSTVRKKLKEYEAAGILQSDKQGRVRRYRRAPDVPLPPVEVLDFFSEVAPCGVLGEAVADRLPAGEPIFTFKHHYITAALDDGVFLALVDAIHQRRWVTLRFARSGVREQRVLPLQIFVSVQNGRRYVMAYTPSGQRIRSVRLDRIGDVTAGEICDEFDTWRAELDRLRPHMWGASTCGTSGRLERVEFTVRAGAGEEYIHQRLEREKRCGTVERLDAQTSRFCAEVYDPGELVPWIRTFLCRITSLHCTDPAWERQFWRDVRQMNRLYGVEEVDT